MTTHAKPLEWTGEATSAVRFLASMPTGSTTLTTRDLRSLLLNTGGRMMARGYLYDDSHRRVSARACTASRCVEKIEERDMTCFYLSTPLRRKPIGNPQHTAIRSERR